MNQNKSLFQLKWLRSVIIFSTFCADQVLFFLNVKTQGTFLRDHPAGPFFLHPHCLTAGLCNMVKHISAQKRVMHKTPLYMEVNEIPWQNKIYHWCVPINNHPCQVTHGSYIIRRFLCFRVYVLGKILKAPATWNTALSECVSQMLHKICLQAFLPHLCIKLSAYFFRPDASLETQCMGFL